MRISDWSSDVCSSDLVGQAQLARVLFPLGDLSKPEVRTIATRAGLPVHRKKDSTGICFIGEREFREFLSTYLKPDPGEIVDDRGRVIGQHQGLMYYTLGQRRGLGIGGVRDARDAPWFVIAKDRSEEHTSELQSLMRSSYAVICLN